MEDINILGEYENIELTTLLRTLKKEGIKNFVVVRKNKLENLIKAYKELEEENKIYKEELEKIDKVLNLEEGRAAPYRYEIIESLQRGITQLKKIIDNSIPFSLVEEKIEELKEKRDDYLYKLQVYGDFRINEPNYSDLILQINFKIQVLQELLEKRK